MNAKSDLDCLKESNITYERASRIEFKSIDELSKIYTNWAEMHCKHGNIESAVEVLKYACMDSKCKLNNNIKCW